MNDGAMTVDIGTLTVVIVLCVIVSYIAGYLIGYLSCQTDIIPKKYPRRPIKPNTEIWDK